MIPLHVHSSYSPLGGLSHPKEICLWAQQNALEAIAITDTNGFYGLHFFLEEARRHHIKPIIGVELIWEDYRVVALCLSSRGYEKLCSLISKIQLKKIDRDLFLFSLKALGTDAAVFTDQKETLLELQGIPHLYFELSPGFFNHQDVLWARNLEIPLLPTTRARYINPEDHFYYLLIQAIKENKTLSSLKLPHYNSRCRLYSPSEFSPYLESIKNTYDLARICWSPPKSFPIIFPQFKKMDIRECDQVLRQKSYAGIAWRYPDGAQGKVIIRLEHELKVISGKGFSSYFLVVEDIVRNSPRTCGRGSGASSLVSFLLGITHVDPIKHNLFFDRFLNPQRVDPPDIDIDFPWDERDHILDYVFLKYPGHAAMVSNHNTLQGRSSLREVAKVMGIPTDEINYIIKRFPRVELNKTWKGIVKHAEHLQGLFQTLSVHPGGVVITPKPIEKYVPLQLTPKGVPVMQWEKRQTESAGLVKIDLLGNRSLAVIRDTIFAVNKNHQKNYLYQTLDPLTDHKTQNLIKSGQTMGVFYIESPASRQLLERMKTHEFEHIVIASSIIRPAANKFAHDFVRRLHGEPYRHLHPLLKPILDETFGIMVYQEQVTQVAMALADFSSSEGNNLRKILDKKDKKKKLSEYQEEFYHKAKKKKIIESTLDSIWEMILSFSGYSFCKAHSASYALVSYKSCYLKANYPGEFMASVISNQGGFYTSFAYLDEARRMNLKILPPDVNYSHYKYLGFKEEIRAGLMQLKGLTKDCSDKIVKQRKNGRYKSLDDFLKRVDLSFEDAKILGRSRAFSSLAKESFCSQMWQIYAYYGAKKGAASSGLLPTVKEYNPLRLIKWELNYLGGGVSFPEWALYKNALKVSGRVRAIDLKYHVGKEVMIFGIYVTGKRVRTKNHESMYFATFSDETGLIEGVLFPGPYMVHRDLLALERAFFIKGKVEETLGSIQIKIQEVSKVTNIAGF